MQFPRIEVEQLLNEHFEELEALWERQPFDEVTVIALTIKEFMVDHGLRQVDEGLQRFMAFKQQQARQLAALGLQRGTDLSNRLPSAQQLTPQAV